MKRRFVPGMPVVKACMMLSSQPGPPQSLPSYRAIWLRMSRRWTVKYVNTGRTLQRG